MTARGLVRHGSVWLPLIALALFMNAAQIDSGYLLRNLVPLLLAGCLLSAHLLRNQGQWLGSEPRLGLASLGFAAVVVGLNAYVHALWFYDIDALRTLATQPRLLFRFLPAYTLLAAGIGFAIGWVIGRNFQH